MNKNLNNYLVGLLIVAVIACMSGCGNSRSRKPKPRKIWECRTERYLERVAEEAEITVREAQERIREACEKQSAADSVSARDTISLYEPRYMEAKARLDEARLRLDRYYEYNEDYETALAKYNEIAESLNVVIKTYERALKELATARGEMVKEAEADLDEALSDRIEVVAYRHVVNIPPEEWSQEDSILMKQIYDFCVKTERNGWGCRIARRLVEHMQSLE